MQMVAAKMADKEGRERRDEYERDESPRPRDAGRLYELVLEAQRNGDKAAATGARERLDAAEPPAPGLDKEGCSQAKVRPHPISAA